MLDPWVSGLVCSLALVGLCILVGMDVRSLGVWSGVFPGVSRLCILVGMDVRSLGVWSGVFPGVSR